MMGEAHERAVDRSHSFCDQFLRGTLPRALACVTALLRKFKLLANAVTRRPCLEYDKVTIDQILRASVGSGAFQVRIFIVCESQ